MLVLKKVKFSQPAHGGSGSICQMSRLTTTKPFKSKTMLTFFSEFNSEFSILKVDGENVLEEITEVQTWYGFFFLKNKSIYYLIFCKKIDK